MPHAFTLTPALALLTLLSGCASSGAADHALQNATLALGGLFNPKPAQAQGGGSGSAMPAAQAGKLVVINATHIMVEAPHPAEPRWQGKLLADTPLNKFFEKHPISRPGDHWPRVSIKILDYSESLTADNGVELQYMAQPGSRQPPVPRPTECLKFDALIWMSERQSQHVDGVVLCNTDIKASDDFLSLGALRAYRNLMAPVSISSEQLRTAGPRVPSKLLPSESRAELNFYGKGQHLFSALFVQMGYRGGLDGDQRLWFVNLLK